MTQTAARFSWSDYPKFYNRLPDDVDKSFARLLLRDGYMGTIRAGLDIISQFGACDLLGLFLLHRHFEAIPDTVFLERPFTPGVAGHEPVFVTSPASKTAFPPTAAPHRFRISPSGTLQFLEFTTDPIADENWARLQAQKELLRALGKCLAENRFSSILGVAIYQRDPPMKEKTRVYIEETDFEAKTSTVHILPELPRAPGRLIPTIWTCENMGNGCCNAFCRAYCSHPDSGQIGYCGHRSTGHIGCS